MSVACTICESYHGHNQEEHNDYYEAQIAKLSAEVEALKGHIHTVDLLSDMSNEAAETTTPLVEGVNNEGQEIWKEM